MAAYRSATFSTVGDRELTLDILDPGTPPQGDHVALVHFHGGFLTVGEKQTFPPAWLINACSRRNWTYVTPAYRLLPEATGQNIVDDAVNAIKWVSENLSSRVIVAGSSAGGYLALTSTTLLRDVKPLAVLSIYGMNDLSTDDYTQKGNTLMGMPPLGNLDELIEDITTARVEAKFAEGHEMAEDPSDKRMQWISAMHEAALYPDFITGIPGIAAQISEKGVRSVAQDQQKFFPLDFGLPRGFPPTALLHGDQDSCVSVRQSRLAFEKLHASGIEVHLEIVSGKDHGFDLEVSSEISMESSSGDSTITAQLRNILDFIDLAVKNVSL